MNNAALEKALEDVGTMEGFEVGTTDQTPDRCHLDWFFAMLEALPTEYKDLLAAAPEAWKTPAWADAACQAIRELSAKVEWWRNHADEIFQTKVDETEALIDENKRLREHLAECADRFERCCILGGSDKEYAKRAVKKYRDALSEHTVTKTPAPAVREEAGLAPRIGAQDATNNRPSGVKCPLPFRDDDGTVKTCIEAGHCGCGLASVSVEETGK